MEEKTFIQLWKGLTQAEKNELAYVLASMCNMSVESVSQWGSGIRRAKRSSQEITLKHLREKYDYKGTCETLFPMS